MVSNTAFMIFMLLTMVTCLGIGCVVGYNTAMDEKEMSEDVDDQE